MITISLCMIVKNEEDVIARCLESAKDIVDEIIIVDTGSTDKTKEIASAYTANIYNFKWIDDFSAARNYAFSKANKEYILWLDADDIILELDRENFKQLKETIDNSINVVMMKYNVGFDANGNVTLSYFRERLSKRSCNFKWKDPIHEYLETFGRIINSEIAITHRKEHPAPAGRNLAIYTNIIAKGKTLSPRGLFYYARELYYNKIFDKAIEYFNKFLDTKKGWVEDNISACFDLSICYDTVHDTDNMLKTLLKSFQYDTPRAEICCQLGNLYFAKLDYTRAIVWYKIALDLKKPTESWGFISHDYWGYIPSIQLCVCNDKLGNLSEAIKYNNKAAEFKPDSPAVAQNRSYLESISK